jgi:hypothetical protein
MDELDKIRELAGIKTYQNSAQGSNISITGNEKAQLMREHNIKPGTPAWFKLWFTLPYLTNTSILDS